jgi:hypothetical protein
MLVLTFMWKEKLDGGVRSPLLLAAAAGPGARGLLPSRLDRSTKEQHGGGLRFHTLAVAFQNTGGGGIQYFIFPRYVTASFQLNKPSCFKVNTWARSTGFGWRLQKNYGPICGSEHEHEPIR